MSRKSCNSCGALFDEGLIDSNQAAMQAGRLYCPKCAKAYSLKPNSVPGKGTAGKERHAVGAQEKTPQATYVPTQRAPEPNKKKLKTTQIIDEAPFEKKPSNSSRRRFGKHAPGMNEPDSSHGDALAQASRIRRRRTSTSIHRPEIAHRSGRVSKSLEKPVSTSPLQTKHFLIGIALLCTGIGFFFILQSEIFSRIARVAPGETSDSAPHVEAPDQEMADALNPNTGGLPQGDIGAQATPKQPAIPEACDQEFAVLLRRDLDLDTDIRADRMSWRLKRGTPVWGAKLMVLGDFEDAAEILNWTFRPSETIEAWLGTRGITSGEKSLRLKIDGANSVLDNTEFYLELPSDVQWDWTGAEELAVDFENPMFDAVDVKVIVGSGRRNTDAAKETLWSAQIPPGQSKHASFPIKQIADPRHVWKLGIKIPHPKKRPVLIYVDRLVLSGAFGQN